MRGVLSQPHPRGPRDPQARGKCPKRGPSGLGLCPPVAFPLRGRQGWGGLMVAHHERGGQEGWQCRGRVPVPVPIPVPPQLLPGPAHPCAGQPLPWQPPPLPPWAARCHGDGSPLWEQPVATAASPPPPPVGQDGGGAPYSRGRAPTPWGSYGPLGHPPPPGNGSVTGLGGGAMAAAPCARGSPSVGWGPRAPAWDGALPRRHKAGVRSGGTGVGGLGGVAQGCSVQGHAGGSGQGLCPRVLVPGGSGGIGGPGCGCWSLGSLAWGRLPGPGGDDGLCHRG